MKSQRLFAGLCAGLVFALVTSSFARAQDYPARPITIIVPYTPGGSTEILARIVGQKLESGCVCREIVIGLLPFPARGAE